MPDSQQETTCNPGNCWRRVGAMRYSSNRLLAALILGLAPVLAAEATELRRMQTVTTDAGTRATLHLGGQPDYKVFSLANPDRVVVDLKGGRLGRDFTPVHGGVVDNVRHGKQGSDLRLVFDLGATAQT